MRSYIRHPASMPIEFNQNNKTSGRPKQLENISGGGLCFLSDTAVETGSQVSITIPNLKHDFTETAIVMWCKPQKERYQIGVKFRNSESTFRMRMIEQICYIEKYRSEMQAAGRELSWAEASSEWISRYAASFPKDL